MSDPVIGRPFDQAQGRLRASMGTLAGERHPVTSPAALHKAQEYLTEAFGRLGLIVSSHPFEALGGRYQNVIATTPGLQPTEAPLIVAAHYDTVPGSPGADDNASSLAVMLEVAHSLRTVSLSRPVRFIAFCLEEEDLLGSLAYAAHLRTTGQEISGAIVLECVGYASSQEGSQQAPPSTPIPVPSVGDFLAIVGNVASAELAAAIEHSAKLAHGLKTISLLVPGKGERLPDTRRSDHAAFWHYGYQAVMLTDTANFRNPHYHQSTDTPDTLDFTFMARVTEAVTQTIRCLAGSRSVEGE